MLPAEGMEGVANVVPFATTGPKATATQKAFIRALLLAQTAEGYKSLCRTIANAKRPRYEDIKCPLLIIAGSHDKTAPLTGSQDILNRYVHARGSLGCDFSGRFLNYSQLGS